MGVQPTKRPNRFGSGGLFPLVAVIVLMLGQIAAIETRTRESGPSVREGAAQSWIDTLVVVVLGTLVGLLVVRAPAASREKRLRTRFPPPGGIVMCATRTPPLVVALAELREHGIRDDRVPRLPAIFTLVGANSGLGIWVQATGSVAPWSLEWDVVEDVAVGEVEERARRANALMVTVRALDGHLVVLPFALSGAGLGGLLPQGKSKIATMVQALQEIRFARKPNPEKSD